jgi:hypothetical protein
LSGKTALFIIHSEPTTRIALWEMPEKFDKELQKVAIKVE